jgi:hypothetical protein
MRVLLIFVFFMSSVSLGSSFGDVGEITSITNVSKGGNPSDSRRDATAVISPQPTGGEQVLRTYVLLAAPGRVSTLTTKAWMFGSQPVGPYTSEMGKMLSSSVGLIRVKKARTLSMRTCIGSRTSRKALDTRSASS